MTFIVISKTIMFANKILKYFIATMVTVTAVAIKNLTL